MPIIPDLPSVQGDWRPATPSLRTAMAPGFALADLGQDIGTVANVATEISQKIQNVRNEDAIVQMRTGVMKAQADHEIFRSKSPDPSTWEADMQQRYSNLADNFKDLKLNPDGRRQLDQTFALTRAQDLENTRVAATQYEITRARQNITNLDFKYREKGDFKASHAIQQKAAENGVFTPHESTANMEDLREEETRWQAKQADKQLYHQISLDPAHWLEQNPKPPAGMTPVHFVQAQTYARDVLRQETVETVDRIRDGTITGDIRSAEDIDHFAAYLRPAVRDQLKQEFAARGDAVEIARRSTPEYQNLTIGKVSGMLAAYQPTADDYDANYVAMDSMVRSLPNGPARSELEKRLNEVREGKQAELKTTTDAAMAEVDKLADSGTFGNLNASGIRRQSTRSALDAGLLLDQKKLILGGFDAAQAQAIAAADENALFQAGLDRTLAGTPEGRAALFRNHYSRRSGKDQADPYLKSAFTAVLDDSPHFETLDPELEKTAILERTAAQEKYGRVKSNLAQWLKLTPGATLTEINDHIYQLSEKEIRSSFSTGILSTPPTPPSPAPRLQAKWSNLFNLPTDMAYTLTPPLPPSVRKTMDEALALPDPLEIQPPLPDTSPLPLPDQTAPAIPQSSAPPSLLPAFGENPWDIQQREYQARQNDWYRQAQDKVDRAALEPQKFYQDKDISFFRDPEEAMKLTTNDLYLTMIQGGGPLPSGDLERRLLRFRAAHQFFGGRGADSEEAFNTEIVKDASRRKSASELTATLMLDATKSAIIQSGGEAGNLVNYQTWTKAHKDAPGYDKDMAGDYAEAFYSMRRAAIQTQEEYAPQLKAVRTAMVNDGNVGLEVRKTYDALPNPESRTRWLSALKVLSETLPNEQQPEFWRNVAKQSARDMGGLAGSVRDFAVTHTEMFSHARESEQLPDIYPSEMRRKEEFRKGLNTEDDRSRREADFRADVERIRQGSFDPIKYLSADSDGIFSLRTLEKGAYSLPGALASSVVAAAPGGMAAFYAASHEQIYQDYRQSFQDQGMSYDDARSRAERIAPFAAVPVVLMEKLQAEAILGKLPFFEKAVAEVADQMESRALRFGVRALARGIEESAIEKMQDLVPAAVQDIAHSLQQDIPDVVWRNGRNGVLDGFWQDSASMFVTMLPLAIFGAMGGISSDQRVKAFEKASDAQILALGAAPEDLTAVRSALRKGNYSTTQAIDGLMSRLDPQSDTAKAATQELQSQFDSQQQKIQDSQSSGTYPIIQRNPEGGYNVIEPTTGESITQASNLSQATRIAETLSQARAEELSGINPYRNSDGSLRMKEIPEHLKSSPLVPYDQKLITLLNDQQKSDSLYDALPESKGGKVIGTDIARELLPEYAASREGKIQYTQATSRGAKLYAMDRLWREIENPNGREKLMFTAGGVAAGKSSVVTDELVSNHDLVFDGTLRETDWALKTIDRALQKGWDITINYIQRPMDLVVQGAIDRAEMGGRWGPISSLAETHQEAQNSILKIAKHFEGNPSVEIRPWINEGLSKDITPKRISLADIDEEGPYSYDNEHDTSGTESLARSQRQSNHERFRAESRQSIVTRFTAAVESGNYSRDILSRIAQGDAELEGILKDSLASNLTPENENGETFTIHEGSRKSRQPSHQQSYAEKLHLTEQILDKIVPAIVEETKGLAPNRSKQSNRSKYLLSETPIATPEERKMVFAPFEIFLAYDNNGSFEKSYIGQETFTNLPISWLKDADHPDGFERIYTHNHPGGRGPSSSDIGVALMYPKTTFRIITRNENKKIELFVLKAKVKSSPVTIERITKEYRARCLSFGDTAATRRKLINLLAEDYQHIISIQTKIFQ